MATISALAGVAATSLLAAPVLPRAGALAVSAYACAIAAAQLGLLAVGLHLIRGTPILAVPTGTQAGALAYLTVVVTAIVYLTWYSAMQKLGVERVGFVQRHDSRVHTGGRQYRRHRDGFRPASGRSRNRGRRDSRRPHRAAPDTAGPCAVAIPCVRIRQAIRTPVLECCGLLNCLADREQADQAFEGTGVAGEVDSPIGDRVLGWESFHEQCVEGLGVQL